MALTRANGWLCWPAWVFVKRKETGCHHGGLCTPLVLLQTNGDGLTGEGGEGLAASQSLPPRPAGWIGQVSQVPSRGRTGEKKKKRMCFPLPFCRGLTGLGMHVWTTTS